MKKSAGIASIKTKAGFHERLVEKFVQQNLPPREIKPSRTSGMGNFSEKYKDIEYCAAELPVNGRIEIFSVTREPGIIRRFITPVTSRFIVFCVREDERGYKVAWSCSLS